MYDFFEKERRRAAARKGWETRRAREFERREYLKKMREEERRADVQAFADFEKADSGAFNGYDMINAFHAAYNKDNALYIGESDERADVLTPFGTFHAGADGVNCYFFSQQPQKIVRFNYSVYFI